MDQNWILTDLVVMFFGLSSRFAVVLRYILVLNLDNMGDVADMIFNRQQKV